MAMNIFKKASKEKLRFETNLGSLSTEQLWELSLQDLDTLAVGFKKAYDESGEKSFLKDDTKKNQILKLKFDIVLDILETKKASQDKAAKALETKQHNEKIHELIRKKEEEQLGDLSVEELKDMLKK